MSFTVDPGDLQNLAAGFRALLGELEQCGQQVNAVDTGAAGHPSLVGAMDEFRSVWAACIDTLHARVNDLSVNVDASATAYTHADAAIRAAFGR